MTKIVVLIPGIMGSELYLGEELIWPGPVRSLFFPYRMMDQLLDPRLEPKDVIRRYSFSTQYQAIIDDLEHWGYHEKSDPPTLYIFPYDWRRANEHAAEKLSELIARIASEHAAPQITLLAHSMGGLIARYYLESGKFSSVTGHAAVDQLITLATPHKGAPLALIRILGMERAVWLSADQVRRAANHPDYPSAYQLLPPPREPYTWDESPTNSLAELDPFRPEVARRLGLQQSGLDAAASFHACLNPEKRPDGTRYFCFTGTQQKTATLAMLRPDGAALRVRKVEREEAGDGTVPFWSGALAGFRTLPVGGEHSVIYRNRDVRRVLATLLGAPDAVAATPLAYRERNLEVQVAVRERVIPPGARFRVAIDATGGVAKLDGELRVEKAIGDEASHSITWGTVERLRVTYTGPDAETLGLVVNGPITPGAYRTTFYPAGSEVAAGSDELFVQEEQSVNTAGI